MKKESGEKMECCTAYAETKMRVDKETTLAEGWKSLKV